MEVEMKEKKARNKSLIFQVMLVAIIVILILIAPKVREYKNEKEFEQRPIETAYCHFESSPKTFGVNRTECINMKIVSKDFHRINLSQFNLLNYTNYFCTENITDIPDCHTENNYMSTYPLILWTNSTIDGYVCIEYQINFTSNNERDILRYLSTFMQYSYANQTEQRKAFIDCEGRI